MLSEIIKRIGYVSWLPNRQTKHWERRKNTIVAQFDIVFLPLFSLYWANNFCTFLYGVKWDNSDNAAAVIWEIRTFLRVSYSHTNHISFSLCTKSHASSRVKPPPTVHMHEENKWKFTYNADQTEMESQQKEKSFSSSRARSALRPVRIDLKSSSLTLSTLFFCMVN